MLKGIIFDFMRTLYDPEKEELYEGVIPLLQSFRSCGLKLGLVSFGGREKRQLIEKLGLGDLLDWYRVVEEKTPAVFRSFLTEFGLEAGEILVVGDLLDEEIAVGAVLGAQTVWLNRGGQPPSAVVPDATIADIRELKDFVETEAG